MRRKIFATLVAVAFLYMIWPLIFPVLMGGVLAVLFTPWLEKLEARKISHILGSAILTLGITLILILPASLLLFFAAKNGFQELQLWKFSRSEGSGLLGSIMRTPKMTSVMSWVSSYVPMNVSDLGDSFQDVAGSVGGRLAESLGNVLTHLPGMLLGLTVMVVSVYFFLADGQKLIRFFKANTVFTSPQTDELVRVIGGVCRSVILAAVASGAAQSVLEMTGCMLTGTSHIPFIGLLVFVGSFIPLVGASPITFFIAIQHFFAGQQWEGIVLLATALVLIGVDNLVRPWFLGGSGNLHPLLAFLAAIGALQTLGFLGVFLGPIVAALFVATIQTLTHEKAK